MVCYFVASKKCMAENRPTVRLNFSRLIPSNILASLAISIACPYLVYQFLVQHNITILPALSIAGLFPLFFIVQVFIRQKVVDLFGVGALLWIVFLLGSSFLSLFWLIDLNKWLHNVL
jgi:hypothetical protein